MPTYLRGHAVASNPGWRNQVCPVKPGIHSHDSNSWENTYCTSVQDAIGRCFVVLLAMWLRRRRTLRLCSRMVKDMVAGAPFFDPMLHKLSKRVCSLSPLPLRSLAASLHLLAESPIISSLSDHGNQSLTCQLVLEDSLLLCFPNSSSSESMPTVFAWMDAAATIIFWSGKMQLLFEGGYHSSIYAWRTCVTTLCWLEILCCLILEQI